MAHRPLKDRLNIVVSQELTNIAKRPYLYPDEPLSSTERGAVEYVRSLTQAIDAAKHSGHKKLFVIGGPSLLEEASDQADEAVADERKDLSKLGTGSFINMDAASRTPPGPGPTGEVSFNFEGESLLAVVKAILGDFLQQNYVIAPGVSGNVTFSTAKPLRGDQELSILEMLLRWNNTTMVWQDGRYTILPVQQYLR